MELLVDEAPLVERVNRLRAHFGIPEGTPFSQVVQSAGAELGIERHLAEIPTLPGKVDACLQRLPQVKNRLQSGVDMLEKVIGLDIDRDGTIGGEVIPLGEMAESVEPQVMSRDLPEMDAPLSLALERLGLLRTAGPVLVRETLTTFESLEGLAADDLSAAGISEADARRIIAEVERIKKEGQNEKAATAAYGSILASIDGIDATALVAKLSAGGVLSLESLAKLTPAALREQYGVPLGSATKLLEAAKVEREAAAADRKAAAADRKAARVQHFRGPCAPQCKAVACCCVTDDGKYLYGCVPMTLKAGDYHYILPLCLHTGLCPQQGCDPRCYDGDECFFGHIFANTCLCCRQHDPSVHHSGI